MRHYKPSKSLFRHVLRRPKAIPELRKTKITPEIVGISGSGEAAPVSDTATSPMTTDELISRAKRNIGSGETSRSTSFRAAAEDIARAYEQGATQREVAQGVCKSPAWVNRLLKWRDNGYVGAPFGDKLVQGVNRNASPLEPASNEPTSACTTHTLGKNESVESVERERLVDTVETLDSSLAEETVNAAAKAPATKTLSAAHASGDYHLPAGCNRQDPERAFQRLAQEWSSSPVRDLFLDSPKAAQERFLRDVLLPAMGGAKP